MRPYSETIQSIVVALCGGQADVIISFLIADYPTIDERLAIGSVWRNTEGEATGYHGNALWCWQVPIDYNFKVGYCVNS